jgi:hypothetical protein
VTVATGFSRRIRLRRRIGRSLSLLSDPGLRSALVLVAVGIGGFVLFPFAWRGVARTTFVPLQLPWLLSAGVAGICLIGAAFGMLSIHIGRRVDAAHRAAVDEVVRTALEMVDEVSRRR